MTKRHMKLQRSLTVRRLRLTVYMAVAGYGLHVLWWVTAAVWASSCKIANTNASERTTTIAKTISLFLEFDFNQMKHNLGIIGNLIVKHPQPQLCTEFTNIAHST